MVPLSHPLLEILAAIALVDDHDGLEKHLADIARIHLGTSFGLRIAIIQANRADVL